MQKRTLGTSEIEVVPLMLGGNVFGWTADEAASFAVLDAFSERGFNFVDTANVYSAWVPGHMGGESEGVIGRWLQRSGKRDQMVIATKVGMKMGDGSHGLRRDTIVRSAEDSLRRLQTEYIDLYQAHTDDQMTPLEETLAAFQQLIEQGKVRTIGASNYSGERLTAALELAETNGLPRYITLQPEYNLHARKVYEQELAPVAERFGLGVVPYFALASGFLTGKYKSVEDTRGKNRGSRVERYFDERGERILKALEQVSRETGAAQASVALAWLLAQPTVTAPIASATSTQQLEALCAAVDLQLSQAQRQTLTEASAY